MNAAAPTVLWRLFRTTTRDHMWAVILPGGPPFTLAFFANDDMDRIENYESMDLAVFRANEIKRSLVADEWTED
jgi:hypothetical protein